jgi:hypothetical protein
MELYRLGRTAETRTENAAHWDEKTSSVHILFRGPEHASDFRVGIVWEDVEKLIREFAAKKEPKAVFLRQANDLAVSARLAGWIPKS